MYSTSIEIVIDLTHLYYENTEIIKAAHQWDGFI